MPSDLLNSALKTAAFAAILALPVTAIGALLAASRGIDTNDLWTIASRLAVIYGLATVCLFCVLVFCNVLRKRS